MTNYEILERVEISEAVATIVDNWRKQFDNPSTDQDNCILLIDYLNMPCNKARILKVKGE